MVNFYTGFIVSKEAKKRREAFRELASRFPEARQRKDEEQKLQVQDKLASRSPRGTIEDVADHIDHLVKLAGVDHVGIGSDFDGITSWPVGLEDVSDYPRLTDELLRRGYSEADLHKILGRNILRVLKDAESVAERLQSSTRYEIDSGEGLK